MTTDGVNIAEDADMAECDGDKVVTMMDVLQEQQDFEEDANAVLGASDDKNCTYSKGYIKRQALYACLTCCTEAKTDPTKRAGVCLACSLNCHENHELIELYTKRNFRCDCGNPKFNSNPCQFTQDKNDLNDENIYNQNFSGLYCTCQRPYPDPESTFEDDMIQCIICEDWLHASHLEAVVPANDQYSEMICKSCMEKNEFLHDYSGFAIKAETDDVYIITVNGNAKSAEDSLCNGDLDKKKLFNDTEENKIESETTNVDETVKINGDVEMSEENEKSEDKAITDIKTDKIDKSSASKTNKDKLSNLESIETESENSEKPDNYDNIKMDLYSGSNKEEQPKEATEINEQAKNNENKETGIEKENKDNTDTQSEDKPDLTKNISEVEQINETATDKQTDSTDKMDDSKTEKKVEASKEKPETEIQEHTEQLINKEIGDGDHATDTCEKTEQQLLDDLTALTADNISEEIKQTAMKEIPIENTEPSESKKTESNTNDEELPKETTHEIDDSSEDKPVAKTANGNIEVPDTSQTDQIEKEKNDDKTDSVMEAIDELLETTNEVKDDESAEENKESASESTESKKNTENIETQESDDIEMSLNKPNDEVADKIDETADTNDKSNADVEMNETTIQNESTVIKKQSDNEPAVDSEIKDVSDKEASDNTSKTEASVEESKVDNDSPKEADEKSKVSDTVNETEKEFVESTNEDDDSTNRNEPADDSQVLNATKNTSEYKRKLSADLTDDTSSKKAKLECVRPKGVKRVYKGATFWPSNFRQKLCTCGECISMYKDLKVLFLTDPEDTVSAYESLGKENVAGGASQYEKGLQALSSLDRIQQINALTEYNKMRDKLLDFLKSFKDRKEIVKEEDIKAFFAGMKPRREPDGVYFCR